MTEYDAILVVSFGGPEKPDDVIPFLENVLRGRNVPRERMMAVAEHYYHFGGKSPINDQNRALIAGLESLLAAEGPHLPVYWGNRNWHPLLPDTLRQMRDDGVRRAIAFFTSAYSSYSGCRQYRENILAARSEVGAGAPDVEKLRVFYNHPGFIGPVTENVKAALAKCAATHIAFTAHSIPSSMADTSNYVRQLEEACRLVANAVGVTDYKLVYQSRSGPPTQSWLEPDICDHLRTLAHRSVVICPIGFISDHLEVLYDLDTEAAAVCAELGIHMQRAAAVGTHPEFIRMIRDLILERIDGATPRLSLGVLGPSHDVCPVDCCPGLRRP
ncbi:MAG: ferrochelatase [Bryobacteraceae bacterium]